MPGLVDPVITNLKEISKGPTASPVVTQRLLLWVPPSTSLSYEGLVANHKLSATKEPIDAMCIFARSH